MSETKTLAQVGAEMSRQVAKWGEQNHPSYTGFGMDTTTTPMHAADAQWFKFFCDRKAGEGTLSWNDILMEEVYEAQDEAKKLTRLLTFDQNHPDAQATRAKLREELIQVAAVAVSWVESIDRNGH